MNLTEEIRLWLKAEGADLVGFADLSPLIKGQMKVGLSVGISLPKELVKSIETGPNETYYETYYELNQKLDTLVKGAAEFLVARGYKAYAQTTDVVVENEAYRTSLPHKTVATMAGLGWIGKSALLVTEQFGSAIRLSSLLTDAPLECGEPIIQSKCGSCKVCTEACPGRAISGKNWEADLDRDVFFNPYKCRKKAREIAAKQINKEITLCGKCIVVCPYTRRYVKGNLIKSQEGQNHQHISESKGESSS